MRCTYTAGAAVRARPVLQGTSRSERAAAWSECPLPTASPRGHSPLAPAHAVTHLPQPMRSPTTCPSPRGHPLSPRAHPLAQPCPLGPRGVAMPRGCCGGAAADLWCLPKVADLAAAEPRRGTTGTSRARHCTRMSRMHPGGKASTCMPSGALRVAHGRAPLHLLHLSTLADARRRDAPPHGGVAFLAAPQLATLASWGGLPSRLTVHALGAARGRAVGPPAEDPMSGCGALVMRAARC